MSICDFISLTWAISATINDGGSTNCFSSPSWASTRAAAGGGAGAAAAPPLPLFNDDEDEEDEERRDVAAGADTFVRLVGGGVGVAPVRKEGWSSSLAGGGEPRIGGGDDDDGTGELERVAAFFSTKLLADDADDDDDDASLLSFDCFVSSSLVLPIDIYHTYTPCKQIVSLQMIPGRMSLPFCDAFLVTTLAFACLAAAARVLRVLLVSVSWLIRRELCALDAIQAQLPSALWGSCVRGTAITFKSKWLLHHQPLYIGLCKAI